MKQYLIFSHEYPPFQGGVGNYAQGVADAMHQAGIPVSVVTTSIPPKVAEPDKNRAPRILINTTEKNGSLRFLYHLFRYIQLLKRYPNAHLHAMDWQSWKIFSVINLLQSRPYSITLHGSEILATRHSLRTRLLGIKMPFRGIRHISVNSRDTRDRLSISFPFWPKNKIRVAYPSPQESILNYAPKAPPTHTPKIDTLRVITVARIEPRKGHLMALKALRELAEENKKQIEWSIIGETIDTHYYEQLRKEAMVAPLKIQFYGKLPTRELVDEFVKADLFLLTGTAHPTKTEGFGMVYLEAGLFGLPSVATATGGVSEAVLDNQTGLLSSPNDSDALKHNLMRLSSDRDLRHKLGQQAYKHARTFTWQRTATAIFPELEAHLHE